MARNKAKKLAQQYVNVLKKKKFPFSSVFLFGSYAKGTAHKWSDIDVCVVSKRFGSNKWDDYIKQLWYWRRDVDPRIEPIGMTPVELAGLSPLSDEIKKTGIRVA